MLKYIVAFILPLLSIAWIGAGNGEESTEISASPRVYNYASPSAPDTKPNVSVENRFTATVADLYSNLTLEKQGLSYEAFNSAMLKHEELESKGLLSDLDIITVMDVTKSSKEERFFVIDLETRKILYKTYAAHGRGSGVEFANIFSNTPNSKMTSLGAYVTAETYYGKNGFSLKLDGVDKGFNDKARKRGIVVHGSDYVGEGFINKVGRLGRSEGCPALPKENFKEIISTIKDGTMLFVYAGDYTYEKSNLTKVKEFLGIGKGKIL